MSPREFFALLSKENRKRGSHKLNPPLKPAVLDRARKSGREKCVPRDFLELLKIHNGFVLYPTRQTPNGRIAVAGLERILDHDQIREQLPILEDHDIPENALLLAQDGNGVEYIIVDPDRGYVRLRLQQEEGKVIGRSVAELLDYLVRDVLDSEKKLLWDMWSSDGTAAQTRCAHVASLHREEVIDVAAGADVLFMSTRLLGTEPPVYDIYRSDGTYSGTSILQRLSNLEVSVPATDLAALGPDVIFFTEDAKGRARLWKVDAETRDGTVLAEFSEAPLEPQERSRMMTMVEGKAYFVSYPLEGGRQLWVSDGTVKGTCCLRAFRGLGPVHLVGMRGKLHFLGESA